MARMIEYSRRAVTALFVLLVIGTVFQSLLPGESLVESSSASLGDSLGNKPVPNWSGEGLITLEAAESDRPLFTVWDARGRAVRTTAFMLPGTSRIVVQSFAHGTDGVIAFCGSAWDQAGHGAPVVAWVSADGADPKVIRTEPYYPTKVTIASDGTIWSIGYEYVAGEVRRGTPLNPEARIFRRWSPSGNLVASYLPQKELGNAISNLSQPGQSFSAGRDRIAWFAPVASRYFEISLAGGLTDINGVAIPDKSEVYGFALLDNGMTVLSYEARDYSGWAVVRLDRVNHQWVEVETGHNPPVLIFGAHANQIVGRQGGLTGDFKFFDMRP